MVATSACRCAAFIKGGLLGFRELGRPPFAPWSLKLALKESLSLKPGGDENTGHHVRGGLGVKNRVVARRPAVPFCPRGNRPWNLATLNCGSRERYFECLAVEAYEPPADPDCRR